MNTILIVTSDDGLRTRLMSALSHHSVFTAPNDAEALKTLRLIEIDVVLRGGVGMPRDIESFMARVRAIAPSALTVAIGVTEESETADFALPVTFTQRELDGVLRRVVDKLRLTREITALRASAMEASERSRVASPVRMAIADTASAVFLALDSVSTQRDTVLTGNT